MELSEREKVLEQLKRLVPEGKLRLVLKVKSTPGSLEPMPDPKIYESDVEYREALIARAARIGKSSVESLANRLRARALVVSEGQLTSSLVVEGNLEELDDAMAEPEVENAMADLPLSSPDSRPVGFD